MRDVKFKFWLGHTKKMIGPIHLSEVGKIILEFTDDIIELQFIEKQDNKGVDAYDGDIIEYKYLECNGDISYGTAFIFYKEGIPKLKVINCDIFKKGSIIYMVEDFEIIGNIHSNPELL